MGFQKTQNSWASKILPKTLYYIAIPGTVFPFSESNFQKKLVLQNTFNIQYFCFFNPIRKWGGRGWCSW